MICKKVPFETRLEAKSVSKFKGEQSFGDPYKCKICGFWHLGHKNRTPKKSALGKINRRKSLSRRYINRLLSWIDSFFGVAYEEKK